MATTTLHSLLWTLSANQHGVVSYRQLLDAGLTPSGIRHKIRIGLLHRAARGVYAVGSPSLTQHGLWMTAVLACGEGAALSYESAACLWGIRKAAPNGIEVSLPSCRSCSRDGIVVHRRVALGVTAHLHIPVTTPTDTLIDLAARLPRNALESAVNEGDKLNLVDPESLREALDHVARRPGVGKLRTMLDARTFRLTDSELERYFLPIVRCARLPVPLTGQMLSGFKVDFYWPDLRLVVETDGLRYHRTPAAQARDRERDQALTAAGFTVLRFTHDQVAHRRRHVEATLAQVARRLR